LIQPGVIVCLGATAAQALLGRDFRVSLRRGKVVSGPLVGLSCPLIIRRLCCEPLIPTCGSRSWGYYPGGGVGLLLVIVIILLLMGRI